jgi:hypothetical protein
MGRQGHGASQLRARTAQHLKYGIFQPGWQGAAATPGVALVYVTDSVSSSYRPKGGCGRLRIEHDDHRRDLTPYPERSV